MRFLSSLALAGLILVPVPLVADTIPSDSITVNLRGVGPNNTVTMTLPEVAGLGEDFLTIDLSNVAAFVGREGYVLLCEPGTRDCGPRNRFRNVSDMVVRGILRVTRKPAYFYFSDPLDAAARLMSLYNVRDISMVPAPLGMVEETGNEQDVSRYFNFTAANVVLVTSDIRETPEPATIWLLAVPLLVLVKGRRRRVTLDNGE